MSIKCHVEIEGVVCTPGIPLYFRGLPKIGDAIRLRGAAAGGALYRVRDVVQIQTEKGVKAGASRLSAALIREPADKAGAGEGRIWTACRSRGPAKVLPAEGPGQRRRSMAPASGRRGLAVFAAEAADKGNAALAAHVLGNVSQLG
jgi:hypothetical protein